MALSTVSGLVIEISTRLNEDSNNSGAWARYIDWINLGMQDMATAITPDWLETSAVLTLANGTRTWQTSSLSEFGSMYDVRISAQDVRLAYVPADQFDLMDPNPSDSGVPRLFTIFNDEITFYPTPDSNYGAQCRYIKEVTTVSASSAAHEVPLRYLDPLLTFAVFQGLYKREDYQQAQIMEARYRGMLERIKQDMKDKSAEMKRMIDIREIQKVNKTASDEIVRAFWS